MKSDNSKNQKPVSQPPDATNAAFDPNARAEPTPSMSQFLADRHRADKLPAALRDHPLIKRLIAEGARVINMDDFVESISLGYCPDPDCAFCKELRADAMENITKPEPDPSPTTGEKEMPYESTCEEHNSYCGDLDCEDCSFLRDICGVFGAEVTKAAQSITKARKEADESDDKSDDEGLFGPTLRTRIGNLREAQRISCLDLSKLSEEVYILSKSKGWHPLESPAEDSEQEGAFIERTCNNLHDEISELHEAWRNGQLNQPCDKTEALASLRLPSLSCLEEELADIVIRVADTAAHLGVDLDRAVAVKHMFNTTREHRHGGKKS